MGNMSHFPPYRCMVFGFPTLFLTATFHPTTGLFSAAYKNTLAPSDMKNHCLRIPRPSASSLCLPPQKNISKCCLYSLSPCPYPCNLHLLSTTLQLSPIRQLSPNLRSPMSPYEKIYYTLLSLIDITHICPFPANRNTPLFQPLRPLPNMVSSCCISHPSSLTLPSLTNTHYDSNPGLALAPLFLHLHSLPT